VFFRVVKRATSDYSRNGLREPVQEKYRDPLRSKQKARKITGEQGADSRNDAAE
jgi:hypothetical protein